MGQTSFNKDTLSKFYEKADYQSAKKYLELYKDSIFLHDDSLKVEWLLEYNFTSRDTSFSNILEAINIAEQLDSPTLLLKSRSYLIESYRQVRLYNRALAIIRHQSKNMLPAEEKMVCFFYHRAAAVYNEINYKNDDESFLDTAILYSKKSLKLARKIGYQKAQATSLNELGNIYERTGKLPMAIEVYDSAITLFKNQDLSNYANALKNKGNYFLRYKLYDSSISYYNKVLAIIDSQMVHTLFSDVYMGLKKASKSKGDSLNYFRFSYLEEHYNKLNIENQLNSRIHDLSTAYETEKKDDLIQQAKQETLEEQQQNRVTLLIAALLAVILAMAMYNSISNRKKNKKLQKLLEENEFLVGESNHRIKNNLQLIVSIIGREIYTSDKDEKKLVEISDKINSIASLHQHLYLTDAKENIAIRDYLNDLIDNFYNIKYLEGVELKLDIEEFDLKVEKSVYLGLLITELITNTLKHAFKNENQKQNQISLTIQKKNNQVELLYEDTGVGLKKDQNPSLVQLLCEQLEANLILNKKAGYHLHLSFKT